jgi:uncharacterized protein
VIVRLKDIKEQGLTLDFAEEARLFPALAELVADREIEFLQPVRTSLKVVWAGAMVEVRGQSATRVKLPCGRCLVMQEVPIDAQYELTFVKELPPVSEEDDEDEIELGAEEMGLIEFHGEEIDLREAIQEQIIMALPLRTLCDEACRGLCSQCGANRNEADCQCSPTEFQNRFSVLKEFKPAKK